MAKAAVIVLAGGSGLRLGGAVNKVYVEVGGQPLLAYPLRAFDRSPAVDEIVLVVRRGDLAAAASVVQLASADKTSHVVVGGADRQRSEQAGLESLRPKIAAGSIDVIAIHDGARPFPSDRLIREVIDQARRVGGAVPGLPVAGPLFQRETGAPVEEQLVRMQTPQAFRAAPLLAAYDAAQRSSTFSAVDTAHTIERFGDLDVAVVRGDEDNLKVTYPADLERAETLARGRDGP